MTTETNSECPFAVCINNEGDESALESGKLYRIIPDPKAKIHGYIRVIDESGEDYAYAAKRFYPVALPLDLEQTLLEVA